MIIVESDKAAYFDVDETLVLMDDVDLSRPEVIRIIDKSNNINAYAIPHKAIISQMRKHHSRGHIIFVWSAGGYKWANAVVRALGLETLVYAIVPKGWVWDDKTPNEFLIHCYIKPDKALKSD